MSGEDFDLPRWSTSTSGLPSMAQATGYGGYNQNPPPRLAPMQQSPPQAAGRQPRIGHIQEGDSYLSPTSLSRSSSLGGQNNSTASSRGRRHHQQEDLDAPRQQFYPQNTQQPGDQMYYQQQNNPPKRANTTRDATTASRSPVDPSYANQYSPTVASYPYAPPYAGSHSRNQSIVKTEAHSPPTASPYSPAAPAFPGAPPYPPAQSAGYPTAPPPSTAYTQSNPGSYAPPPPSSPYQQQHPANGPPPAFQPYPMESGPNSHLGPSQRAAHGSTSSPNTPISYGSTPSGYAPSQSPNNFYQNDAMVVDQPQQKRRTSGFRRVRDANELRPTINSQPAGRRMDASGAYLSPLRQLTTNILETYHICNEEFRYESTHNPRRVLTKPSKPSHNEGYDNEDYDYILYVNDWLGQDEGHKYLILDVLGQGTFGQVVKCQNMKTHEIVAVKVVKNKPAYFNQSMMEVTILELLNNQADPDDTHHILRLRDSFIHKHHLCLVFELLSSNLYELIKQNQFQGLSTQLVKVFTAQLLDAMTVLKDARLIHCDLKPENILLKSLQSPTIKIIDFGSACHEKQKVYTYIQSRFYRSPEVLLQLEYTAAIDMWSLGCIAVELFLGLPLFPGTSEYNQITRIVEMLGLPPAHMMEHGKQTNQFFDHFLDQYGQKKYRLKTLEQYSRDHGTNEAPGKKYFKANTLPEIINTATMPTFKAGARHDHEEQKELNQRMSFIDFCQGLLNMNPLERWTPQQARMHPFITGEKFTKPFTPIGLTAQQMSSPSPSADPKRPYGGLVPSQPKGTRAYQDAAQYNHQLAQHQAYTAQAQAASQAPTFRNPYVQQQQQQQQSSPGSYPSSQASGTYPQQAQQYPASQLTPGHRGLAHQTSAGQLAATASSQGYTAQQPPQQTATVNPPSTSYYPNNSRARANTVNNQMDNVPPALARLQHMNQDVIAGRNALTPVLNRDDGLREWERRQQGGKPTTAQPYPELQYLQQQAEGGNWSQGGSGSSSNTAVGQRYQGQQQPLTSAGKIVQQHYHPQQQPAGGPEDDLRRDAVMSNVRAVARGESSQNVNSYSNPSSVISSPAQTYNSGGGTTTGNRYAATYASQGTGQSFDAGTGGTGAGPTMFVPMQPEQYQSYGSTTGRQPQGVAPPPQSVSTAFYGAGPPTGGQQQGQQRNPFQPGDTQQHPGAKDTRRSSGMDGWPRG